MKTYLVYEGKSNTMFIDYGNGLLDYYNDTLGMWLPLDASWDYLTNTYLNIEIHILDMWESGQNELY